MAATTIEIGWEALVAIIVIVFALVLLGIVLMTRDLHNHHLRVGFFIERGAQQSEPGDEWPEPEIEKTAELPAIKEDK